MKKIFLFLFLFFSLIPPAFAENVFWSKELKPFDKQNLIVLGGGMAASLQLRPYDRKVRNYQEGNGYLLMGREDAKNISNVSHGFLEFAVAGTMLLTDYREGLKISRALVYTSLSHLTLTKLTNRERPNHKDHNSWPSGHTASMFALAGSLAGSYGAAGAIPGYGAAVLVAASRIKQNNHWISDVAAGAVLGTYWAMVTQGNSSEKDYAIIPVAIDDGMLITYEKSF